MTLPAEPSCQPAREAGGPCRSEGHASSWLSPQSLHFNGGFDLTWHRQGAFNFSVAVRTAANHTASQAGLCPCMRERGLTNSLKGTRVVA